MQRALLVLILVTTGLLAAGCDAFSSSRSSNQPAPGANPVPKANATPSGPCNSRLGGKITNAATSQGTANAAVEVKSTSKSMKTITDSNGLYAFAGLCAGEYAMTVTPPGAKSVQNPNRVKLNGTEAVKVDFPYR